MDNLYELENPPKNWNKNVWMDMWKIARKMNYQQLAVAWLEASVDQWSDRQFKNQLKLVAGYTKEDLFDFFYEIGSEQAKKFIKKNKKLLI